MKLKDKTTGKTVGMPIGITVGVFMSVAITLACAVFYAWLIGMEKLSMDSIRYIAGVTILLSTSFGSWIAVVKIKRMRTQVCLITGAVYYLVLLSITAAFFDGQYQGIGIGAILVLVGSGLTALLGLGGKKSGKKKFKKRAIC